ncbi:hypothetical protein MRX96_013676 [Rhipicephalus microplus]
MDDDGSVAFETISQETPFAASGRLVIDCHNCRIDWSRIVVFPQEPDSHRRFVTARLPAVRDAGFLGICRSRGGCGLSVDERGGALAAGAELRVRAGYVVRTASWHANPAEREGFSDKGVLSRDGRLSVHLLTKALFHGPATIRN